MAISSMANLFPVKKNETSTYRWNPGANPWARNNHLSIGSGVPYQGPLSLFSHQLVPEWHIDVTPEVSRGRIDGSEIKELNQPFDIENITMVHDFLHPQDEMFDIFQRFRS